MALASPMGLGAVAALSPNHLSQLALDPLLALVVLVEVEEVVASQELVVVQKFKKPLLRNLKM